MLARSGDAHPHPACGSGSCRARNPLSRNESLGKDPFMDATHSAFFLYREATKHLRSLSERQQVLTLKFELFHALQRGNDLQDRARALEIRVAQLEAPPSVREAALDAFARQLHADLVLKSGELDAAQRDREKETRQLRLALRAAETHCELLDELCHGLVATIERAAEDDAVARPDETDSEQAAS
jgi:hypothetical protein